MREAFNAFDTDGDGFLTCDDVMLFFEALGVSAEHNQTVQRSLGQSSFADLAGDAYATGGARDDGHGGHKGHGLY